jgi:hypothetical protein
MDPINSVIKNFAIKFAAPWQNLSVRKYKPTLDSYKNLG